MCILRSDHCRVTPNELLLADWPALKAFDIHTESAAHLPPEAVDVAKEIARIPNLGTGKTVAEAILTLVTADKPICQAFDWAIWLGDLEFQEG